MPSASKKRRREQVIAHTRLIIEELKSTCDGIKTSPLALTSENASVAQNKRAEGVDIFSSMEVHAKYENIDMTSLNNVRSKPLSERRQSPVFPVSNEIVHSINLPIALNIGGGHLNAASLAAGSRSSNRPKTAQEILLESTSQQNSQTNLPPWLRTQSKVIHMSTADSSISPALDSMLQNRAPQNVPQYSTIGFPTSALAAPALIAQTSQIKGSALLSAVPTPHVAGVAAVVNDVSAATGGKGLGFLNPSTGSYSSSNVTAMSAVEAQGQTQAIGTNTISGGPILLPAVMQGASLPIMIGGSLIPNSQPNSSFVRSGTGPMLNSAAQRAAFSATGLNSLGGPIPQEYYQQYNMQLQNGPMQYGTKGPQIQEQNLTQQLPQQTPQQQQQQQLHQSHRLSAGVGGLTPTEGIFVSTAVKSQPQGHVHGQGQGQGQGQVPHSSTPNSNDSSDLAPSAFISLPLAPASISQESSLPVERREPPKMGGKGTFSAISAVAAAAGHVNPLLNPVIKSSSPLDSLSSKISNGSLYLPLGNNPAILGPGPGPGLKAPTGPGPGSGSGQRALGPSGGEISLPLRGPPVLTLPLASGVPLDGSAGVTGKGAKVAVKTAVVKDKDKDKDKDKEKVSVKEVRSIRVSQTKTQREKVKERKTREAAEKEQEKAAEIEAERKMEQEREKERVKDKEKETVLQQAIDKEKLREDKEREIAAAALASAAVTYSDLKLESLTALSKRKELTTAKLLALERRTMLARKGPPPYLPRPRNHWDYLLDEVQWMAVDFKQERRLKIAHCHAVSQMCAESALGRFRYSDSQSGLRGASTADTVAANLSVHPAGIEYGNNEQSISNPDLLPNPKVSTAINESTLEFTNRERKTRASNISCMVKQYWKSFSDSLGVHRIEAVELLRACKAIKEEVDEELSTVTTLTAADPGIIIEIKSNGNDLQNERISSCLSDTNHLISPQCSAELILSADSDDYKRRHNDNDRDCDFVSDSDQIPGSHSASSLNSPARRLHHHQQQALDAVIERNNLGYGALLYGDNYTGRTALCSMMANIWLRSSAERNTRFRGEAVAAAIADPTVLRSEKESSSTRFGEDGDVKCHDISVDSASTVTPADLSSPISGTMDIEHTSTKTTFSTTSVDQCNNRDDENGSHLKKPVLVIAPRYSLVKWLSEFQKSCPWYNVQLWIPRTDSLVKKENDCGNGFDMEGTPDVLLSTLEHIHLLLQSEGKPMTSKGIPECNWSGVIVDVRGMSRAALNSSLLLHSFPRDKIKMPDMKIDIDRTVGMKIKLEGGIYSATTVMQTNNHSDGSAQVDRVKATSRLLHNEVQHWLDQLSELLPSSLTNRCLVSDVKKFDIQSENNALISFLLPQQRDSGSGQGSGRQPSTVVYELSSSSSSKVEEVLNRLSVHVQISSEVGARARHGVEEEILAVEMGPQQHRKYCTALDYLMTRGAFKGNNVANVAKGVMILRLICFHENAVYIGVDNESQEIFEKEKDKDKDKPGVASKQVLGNQFANARTKSDLSAKDAISLECKSSEKERNSEIADEILIPLSSDKEAAAITSVKMELEGEVQAENQGPGSIAPDALPDEIEVQKKGKGDGKREDRAEGSAEKEINSSTETVIKEETKLEKETKMEVDFDNNDSPSAPVSVSNSFVTSCPTDAVLHELPEAKAVRLNLSCPAYVAGSRQQLRFCIGGLSARLTVPSAFDMTGQISTLLSSSSSSLSSSSSSSSLSFALSGDTRSSRTYSGDDCQVSRSGAQALDSSRFEDSCKLTALRDLLNRFSGQKVVVAVETEDEILTVRRYLERNRINHTYASSARESWERGREREREKYGTDIYARKGHSSCERAESKVRGLEGDMGEGLAWLRGQSEIDAFNVLKSHQGHVLLVTSDLFRCGGLLPHHADVVIVLSENWGVEQTDIQHCYTLRAMNLESSSNATHVRIIRVVSKGTLEETLVRKKGHITALQGVRISSLLQTECSSIPSSVIACDELPLDGGSSLTLRDPGCLGNTSPTDRSKSVRSCSFSSAVSTSSVPACGSKERSTDVFLSCAPSMVKGQGILYRSRSRSRSKSMSLSLPSSLPAACHRERKTAEDAPVEDAVISTSALSSSEGAVVSDATEALGAPDMVPVVVNYPINLSLSAPLTDVSPIYELDSPYSMVVAASCDNSSMPDSDTLTVRMDEILFSDSAEDETPTPVPEREIEGCSSDVQTVKDLNDLHKGGNLVDAIVKVPKETSNSSGTKADAKGEEDSSEEELLAGRWKRAFLRAFKDVERRLTHKGNDLSFLHFNFITPSAPTLSSLPSSLSVSLLASAPLSYTAAAALAQGVVVKRTYAPRKKSDLSLDSNGEVPLGKNATTPSTGLTQTSRNKDEEEDLDGKKDKSRKADRKKDRRKALLTIADDATLLPSASTSISSFSLASSFTFPSPTITAPSGLTTSILPTVMLSSLSSLSTASSSSLPSLIKDAEFSGADCIPVTESLEIACNFGCEDLEEDTAYESCWSVNRLAHTVLAHSLWGIGPHSTGPDKLKGLEKGMFRRGLVLQMAYTISREWQLQVENANEELIAGVAKPPVPLLRGLLNSSGTQNPVGRPPSNPALLHAFPPTGLSNTASLSDLNNHSSTSAITITAGNITGIAPPFNASQYYKSHGRLKLKPEFGPGFQNPPPQRSADGEGRLNRRILSEVDKVRLRRAGVGVSDAEQLFWSLIEPFINIPLDRTKEVPKRPPGALGGNIGQLPVTATHASYSQSFSAISFHDTIRELRRKGISVDSHVHVHPLQNAMRCDLQLVPTWERKSAITDSHTRFTIRYVVPRSNSSKSSRKSRAQILNPRGERDKEPVRKRVLDQPMLIPNIRIVRPRLETGVNSRPSSLGGTVNPLFTRLPPIRTLLKPRALSEAEMKSLGWTKAEDSIIAVVNHLYTDPYGLVTQKALESYRPFPFQSSVTAPSIPNRPQGQGKGQMVLNAHGQPVPAPPTAQPYTFPIRTPKQVLDRVTWQQKSPQDETFGGDEVTFNRRFAPYLVEFGSWKSGDMCKKESGQEEAKERMTTCKADLLGFWAEKEKQPSCHSRGALLYSNGLSCSGGDILADSSGDEDTETEMEVKLEEEEKEKIAHWDGKNGMYFSTGAKSAWWGSHSQTSPSSGSSPIPLSTQLSASSYSSLHPVENFPTALAPPSVPPVDLESYLLAGTDGYADDMDLGFEFGVDDTHDELLVDGTGRGDSANSAPSSSSSCSSAHNYLDPLLKSEKIVTERLFSCSTDYNLDNDVRVRQPQSRRTNVVISVMRKAIKDSERRKPAMQPLPGMSILTGTFSGISEGVAAAGGGGGGEQQLTASARPPGSEGDFISRTAGAPVLGIGMGKGMAIGMVGGKGGKGSISNMGFSHPSHRLALLSGHVHTTMMPGRISEKIRSAREEELVVLATATSAKEALEREAEATRQCHLQTLDREQQVVLAAAQSAAIAARLVRQRPLHSSQNHQQAGTYGLGGRSTGVDRSPRGSGCSPGNPMPHNSPSMSHLHLPPGSSRMTHSLLPQSVISSQSGGSYPVHIGNPSDKEAHVKATATTSVLASALHRAYAPNNSMYTTYPQAPSAGSSHTQPPTSGPLGVPPQTQGHHSTHQQVQLQRPGIQATGLQGNASTQMHAYPNQYTQQQQQQLQGQHQQLQLSSSQLPTQSFHSEHQQHPTQHPMHQQQQLQQKSGVNPLSQQHQQAQAQHIAQQQNLSIPAQILNDSTRGAPWSGSNPLTTLPTPMAVGIAEEFPTTSQAHARYQSKSGSSGGRHMGGTESSGSGTGLGIVAGGRGQGPNQGHASNRPSGTNVSWSSEEMQRLLLNRPDVKAQAQAIMGSRTLQDADKKLQIKELLKKLR